LESSIANRDGRSRTESRSMKVKDKGGFNGLQKLVNEYRYYLHVKIGADSETVLIVKMEQERTTG